MKQTQLTSQKHFNSEKSVDARPLFQSLYSYSITDTSHLHKKETPQHSLHVMHASEICIVLCNKL